MLGGIAHSGRLSGSHECDILSRRAGLSWAGVYYKRIQSSLASCLLFRFTLSWPSQPVKGHADLSPFGSHTSISGILPLGPHGQPGSQMIS